MDDPSRFTSINEYYTFIYAISYMMLVELGIWIYNFKGWLKRPDKKNNDYGTILIVMLGCWGSFYFSTYFRSQQFIQIAGEILLPHIFYYVGIAFILVGTTLRAVAVWSLRYSFTLSVKTGGNQRLVTTGVYRYIRNPAYAGTMLSMLGNAFCFRSVFSPLLVLLILAICYGIRIKVEEKALYERICQGGISRFSEQISDPQAVYKVIHHIEEHGGNHRKRHRHKATLRIPAYKINFCWHDKNFLSLLNE